MGENAKKGWEWHNTVVGEGYQARGVVRQPSSSILTTKVVNLSAKDGSRSNEHIGSAKEKISQDKYKKGRDVDSSNEEDTKSKKLKHEHISNQKRSTEQSVEGKFNPLLQMLSNALRENVNTKC